MFDVIVVGGGAAGFMSAIIAKHTNPSLKIAIIEKTTKVLSKVKVSGGGRCNVTHNCISNAELLKAYPRGAKILKPLFNQFAVKETITFFEKLGVSLITEPDGRMFPTSNTSETVVNALLHAAQNLGITIYLNNKLEDISQNNLQIQIQTTQNTFETKKLILALGGLSQLLHYDFLANFPAQIINPVPSLFTFNIPNKLLHNMAGVSVPNGFVKIIGQKQWISGPILITHWGLSGPAILKTSSIFAIQLNQTAYKFQILINWLGIEQVNFENEWQMYFQANANKLIKNAVFNALPARLWDFLLEISNINPLTKIVELKKASMNKLSQNLLAMPFQIEGKTTFKEEFVTAGGISSASITQNLQLNSNLNIYACGEILDIDGITGGYNFQSAWTTGWFAGSHAALSLGK